MSDWRKWVKGSGQWKREDGEWVIGNKIFGWKGENGTEQVIVNEIFGWKGEFFYLF